VRQLLDGRRLGLERVDLLAHMRVGAARPCASAPSELTCSRRGRVEANVFWYNLFQFHVISESSGMDTKLQEVASDEELELEGEDLELRDVVTERHLSEAAALAPTTLILSDLAMGPDATEASLTRLLCSPTIVALQNRACEELAEPLRAMAEGGHCCELEVTLNGTPVGRVRDALFYAISHNTKLRELHISTRAFYKFAPLWTAIGECRRLEVLHYYDGGCAYANHFALLLRTLGMEHFAAELASLEISLCRSNSQRDLRKMVAVLALLRQFQNLDALVITMRFQATDEDVAAMQQFANDPPPKLQSFCLHDGRGRVCATSFKLRQESSG
jgi:hypothetical protein